MSYLLVVLLYAHQPYGLEVPVITSYKTEIECLTALQAVKDIPGTVVSLTCHKGAKS